MASDQSPIISESLYNSITKWFLIPSNIVISSLGSLSNTANLIVFTKMDNKDTMTLSLIALSLSDLLFSCFNLVANIINCIISNGIPVLLRVHLESLVVVGFVWQRPLFHKISCMITTFVSLERALCVARPFLVKRIFTKKRNIYLLVSFYIVFFVAFMPVYPNQYLKWYDPGNGTEAILVAHLTVERRIIENGLVLTVGLSFIWVSQVVILINALIMGVALRKSRKFRQSLVQTSEKTTKSSTDKVKSPDLQVETVEKDMSSKTSTVSAQPSASSNKEDRLIKTVLTLAIMHISLNAPLSIYYICYVAIPEFAALRRYHNLFMASTELVNILESLNGVFNIFVYLTLNTKYKLLFQALFYNKKPQ